MYPKKPWVYNWVWIFNFFGILVWVAQNQLEILQKYNLKNKRILSFLV